jgi:hypothetical protein
LGESPQLAKGCWSLQQIDEVRPYSSFREEAQSLPGISAFPDSKDLDFQLPSPNLK